MLAVIAAPELKLDADEAKLLAKATADVASFYGTVVSAKAMAWTNLVQCVGMIYGTRLFAIRNRRRDEALRRPARAAPQNAPRPNGNGVNAGPPPNTTEQKPMFMASDLNDPALLNPDYQTQ